MSRVIRAVEEVEREAQRIVQQVAAARVVREAAEHRSTPPVSRGFGGWHPNSPPPSVEAAAPRPEAAREGPPKEYKPTPAPASVGENSQREAGYTPSSIARDAAPRPSVEPSPRPVQTPDRIGDPRLLNTADEPAHVVEAMPAPRRERLLDQLRLLERLISRTFFRR